MLFLNVGAGAEGQSTLSSLFFAMPVASNSWPLADSLELSLRQQFYSNKRIEWHKVVFILSHDSSFIKISFWQEKKTIDTR